VFLVTDSVSGEQLAAKTISKENLKTPRQKSKLYSEIKIHRDLDNNNIVKFQGHFEDSKNVYMLIDLCKNRTMSDVMKKRKRLHELEVKCYTR